MFIQNTSLHQYIIIIQSGFWTFSSWKWLNSQVFHSTSGIYCQWNCRMYLKNTLFKKKKKKKTFTFQDEEYSVQMDKNM